MNEIEVTGCDLIAMVKKAYELSVPQGMGMLHFRPEPLTDEQAAKLFNSNARWPVTLDYVMGRAVKFSVRRDDAGRLWTEARWFDHTPAQLHQVLEAAGVKTAALAT